MEAGEIVQAGYAARPEIPMKAIRFEPFGLRGRRLSGGQRVRRAIFVISIAAALAYYAFLGVLYLLH